MIPGANDLRELARLTRLEQHPQVRPLLDNPMLPASQREKLGKFLRHAAAVECRHYHAFLPGPPRDQAESGIAKLAWVVTGRGPEYVYSFTEDTLLTHVINCASTGGGKSVILVLLGLQVHHSDRATWLFDTEGDLTQYVVANTRDVLVLNYRDIRLGLFEGPIGAELDWPEYLSKLLETWRETLYCRDQMVNLAREVAVDLRRRQGPFTLSDFHDALKSSRFKVRGTRAAEARSSLLNRFGGMLLTPLAETFGAGTHDFQALMKRSIVWQLRGLSEDLLAFFITTLLKWILLAKQVSTSPTLELLLAVDEYTRICNRQRILRADMGESVSLELLRVGRKRNTGVLLATQTPQELPSAVAGLASTLITMRPTDGNFLRCVSDTLNLDQEQEHELMTLSLRSPRRAIVRSPDDQEPFMVEIPELQIKTATEEEIAARRRASQEWLKSIYTPLKRPSSMNTMLTTAQTSSAQTAAVAVTPGAPDLPKDQLDYLTLCAHEPLSPVTARDKRHGIAAAKGTAHRKALVAAGLVTMRRIATGRRGGQVRLTEVTEPGYCLLARFQVKVRRPPGRGGYAHKFWQHVVHRWAQDRGYPSKIEQEIAGKAVDVGVTRQDQHIAIEILVEGLEKELSNVARDLEAGWNQVILCTVKKGTSDRMKRMVLDQFGEELLTRNKVCFKRLRDFLDS